MAEASWQDVGSIEEPKTQPLQQLKVAKTLIALSYANGEFAAVSGLCNHAAGPLGEGILDGDYIVCPWHYWKFHRASGEGEPGFEEDRVPKHDVKIEKDRVLVNVIPTTHRKRKPHAPHPLARDIVREAGPIRIVGISTTAMNVEHPRYSTSEVLLQEALDHAASQLGCSSQMIRLNDLKFRHCEGYYSKSARACTWPCSITQMDANDQLDRVYEAFVHWADVILVATPIRWGAASSLYYKMVERMNCIQNQETIANRYLLKNKVAAFIITGGQDNVQGVAGQLMGFFAEVGCQFPQFPFIAHSRGWSAEDMENNRGGRKAHQLDVKAQL
jgi:multimeric flavodoxin WrbA/nitrite reductase/ring-hydroxylating ferredoxin subunit